MLTLAIIKPDAVQAGNAGKVLAHLEAQGFKVRAARLVRLSQPQAEAFYAVHRERPFFRDLVRFMISGPIMVQVLVITTLLFVYCLNHVLARLAAMLPDETLRSETKLFTRVNQTILLIIIPSLPFYFVVRMVSKLPRFVVEALLFLERGGTFIEVFLLLCFVLLPVAMTMALLWKTKEVIMAGVFSSLNNEPPRPAN